MKKILFVFTGGTIGSTVKGDYISTDENKPYALIEGYKKLFGSFGAYDVLSPYTVLSENLNGEHLSMLINTVKNNLNKEYEGIIVTHGTDTLAYSAAALGYALGNSVIPVCLVSANFPLEDERSNGYINLHGAIRFIRCVGERGVWVSYKNKGDSLRIHRGTRLCPHLCFSDNVFSIKDSYFGAFSEDFVFQRNGAFSEAEDGISPVNNSIEKRCKNTMRLSQYPGMIYPWISSSVKYILLDCYHSGTIDTLSENAREFFDEMKKRGIKIFVTGVDNNVPYESTSVYKALGIIPLPIVSPVSAFVKMWLLESNGINVEKDIFASLGGDIMI